MTNPHAFTAPPFWMLPIAALLFGMAVAHFLLRRIGQRFTQKPHVFLNTMLMRPFLWVLWSLVLWIALHMIPRSLRGDLLKDFSGLLKVLLFAPSWTWFGTRLLRFFEVQWIRKKARDRLFDVTTMHAIAQIGKVVVVVMAVLTSMQVLGIPLAGVLAFGGIGTLAVGFAARTTIENFFGGMMIFIERPFNVGEEIRLPEKNIDGVVEKIGWRLCRMRTPDKRALYVPNALFGNSLIENISRMTHRRIQLTLYVAQQPSEAVIAAMQAVEDALRQHVDVDNTALISAAIAGVHEGELHCMVTVYTTQVKIGDFLVAQQRVLLAVLEILRHHAIGCGYPTSVVHLTQQQAHVPSQ